MPSLGERGIFRRFTDAVGKGLGRSERSPHDPTDQGISPDDPANTIFEAVAYNIEDPFETLQYEPSEFEQHQNESRSGLIRYYRDHYPDATPQEIAWHVAQTETVAKIDRMYKLVEIYGVDSPQVTQLLQLIDFDLTLLNGDSRLPDMTSLPPPQGT